MTGSALATALRQTQILLCLFFRTIPQFRTGSMTSRTKFLDENVHAATADGARQLVILAAGLDTRADRMREELFEVRVFELDLPKAQEYKHECLKRVRLLQDLRDGRSLNIRLG